MYKTKRVTKQGRRAHRHHHQAPVYVDNLGLFRSRQHVRAAEACHFFTVDVFMQLNFFNTRSGGSFSGHDSYFLCFNHFLKELEWLNQISDSSSRTKERFLNRSPHYDETLHQHSRPTVLDRTYDT